MFHAFLHNLCAQKQNSNLIPQLDGNCAVRFLRNGFLSALMTRVWQPSLIDGRFGYRFWQVSIFLHGSTHHTRSSSSANPLSISQISTGQALPF